MLKVLVPLTLLASAISVLGSPSTNISPCGAATLSTYVNSFPFPASDGCAIGILDYSNFTYHPLSNAPLASQIFITPQGQGFGFTRTDEHPFVANLGQVVKFEIDYNILIDPAPVIAGAENRLDPPTGNVSVTEFFCNDHQYFFPSSCFGSTPETLKVGTPASGSPLSASIKFQHPAVGFQTVGILFTLDGTKGPSSFDGLDTSTQVLSAAPEPAPAFLVGLLLLAGGYKLGKQRQS